jgi:RNA ligase (TIGR02306 family)
MGRACAAGDDERRAQVLLCMRTGAGRDAGGARRGEAAADRGRHVRQVAEGGCVMSSLLVEVVRIGEIAKHPNADTLMMTSIKGWNCVIKDGQFNTGDLALYVPIDSVLPDALVEERGLEYLKNGARVRSVKLRQVLSQGLLLTLPHGHRLKEGQQVAEQFGITKWEPPAPSYQGASNTAKATRNRPNPNFTRYCDPENIKNYPGVFKDGDLVVVTEKIHGTNFRAGKVRRNWGNGWWAKVKRFFLHRWLGDWEFAVGSRNVHLVGDNPQFYEGNVYHQIAKRYNLAKVLPEGYTIYGEIYGDKIQDLAYGKSDGEIDVVFFDAKRDERYLTWSEFMMFCSTHGLPAVPTMYWGTYTAAMVSECTSGKSALCPTQIREGCVIKSTDEANDLRIGRKILKSISEAYLLRKDGTEFH